MNLLFKNNQKCLALLLLAVFLFAFLAGPAQNAKAIVVVFDAGNAPSHAANAAAAIAGWSQWNNKNFLLNVAAAVTKLIIRTLRDMVIQWVTTGKTGMPKFTADYFADPSKWAETAARSFLSQLSGINFCNYGINVPQTLSYNLQLNFQFSCSLASPLTTTLRQMALNPNSASFADLYLLSAPENNPIDALYMGQAKKKQAESRALRARRDELRNSGGFLGQRDPKTGKIITPGKFMADVLGKAVDSNWRECDTATDFQVVLTSCVLSAFADIADSFIGKVGNDFLNNSFRP